MQGLTALFARFELLFPEGFAHRDGQILADRIEFPLHGFPQRVKGQNNFIL
jgi:hypothetical protein